MNSLFKNMQINQLSGRLRQIAGTPNVLSMQFSAVDVAGIRESIITIANECKADDPQIARQLLAAKDILFAVNQFGQAFINPYAIGEILFGLDYLAAKGQAPSAEKQTTAEIWSYIHPLIQKSSKKLFEDGHFANAAEDAFIELNSRAKAIYKKLVPSAATVPDGTDLMHMFKKLRHCAIAAFTQFSYLLIKPLVLDRLHGNSYEISAYKEIQ